MANSNKDSTSLNNIDKSNISNNKVRRYHANKNANYRNAHSEVFDELEVILPSQVTQPDLQILVTALQEQILSEYDGFIDNNNIDNEVCMNGNDDCIGIAKQILDHLLMTPIADASVLVAITHEPEPRLLLTKRAGHLNSHAGQVSFAGGKHEPADGNNIVTALREACEETALPPSQVQIVGQLPTQTSKSGMSVRPIVVLIDPDVVYVPELGEIDRIFWADFAALISEPTTDYEIELQQDCQTINILTPCWIIDNETVWGLTGRTIASLLEIAYGRQTPWYYQPIEC